MLHDQLHCISRYSHQSIGGYERQIREGYEYFSRPGLEVCCFLISLDRWRSNTAIMGSACWTPFLRLILTRILKSIADWSSCRQKNFSWLSKSCNMYWLEPPEQRNTETSIANTNLNVSIFLRAPHEKLTSNVLFWPCAQSVPFIDNLHSKFSGEPKRAGFVCMMQILAMLCFPERSVLFKVKNAERCSLSTA